MKTTPTTSVPPSTAFMSAFSRAAGISDITGGRLADVALDLTPAPAPTLDAMAAVRAYGTVVLAGIKGMQPVEGFTPDKIVLRGITIRGALPPSAWASEQSLKALARDPDLFARIPTQLVSLDQAEYGI